MLLKDVGANRRDIDRVDALVVVKEESDEVIMRCQLLPLFGNFAVFDRAHDVDVIRVDAVLDEIVDHDFNLPCVVINGRLSRYVP